MGSRRGGAAHPSSSSDTKDRSLFLCLLGLIQAAPLSLAVFWLFPEFAENDIMLFCMCAALLVLAGGTTALALQFLQIPLSPMPLCFTLVTVTAYADVFFALAVANREEDFPLGQFYVQHGERYLKSAYAFSAMMWDGTFHFAAQFALAFLALRRQRPGTGSSRVYHWLGLVWAGSVINSMAPLLMGALLGPHSHEIGLSITFNLPYIFFPISVAVTLFQQRAASKTVVAGGAGYVPVNHRSLADALVLAFHLTMPGVHVVRALAALGSRQPVAVWWLAAVEPAWGSTNTTDKQDAAFLTAQAAQSVWWLVPFHLYAAYELFQRARTGVRRPGGIEVDVSAVVLGAYLQSTACLVGVSALEMTPEQFLTWRSKPGGGGGEEQGHFWLVNVWSVILSVVSLISLNVSDVDEERSSPPPPPIVLPAAIVDKED